MLSPFCHRPGSIGLDIGIWGQSPLIFRDKSWTPSPGCRLISNCSKIKFWINQVMWWMTIYSQKNVPVLVWELFRGFFLVRSNFASLQAGRHQRCLEPFGLLNFIKQCWAYSRNWKKVILILTFKDFCKVFYIYLLNFKINNTFTCRIALKLIEDFEKNVVFV